MRILILALVLSIAFQAHAQVEGIPGGLGSGLGEGIPGGLGTTPLTSGLGTTPLTSGLGTTPLTSGGRANDDGHTTDAAHATSDDLDRSVEEGCKQAQRLPELLAEA